MRLLRLAAFVAFLLAPGAAQAACGFGSTISAGVCRGYITQGTTTFSVPSDFSATNTIEAVGPGGNGANGTGGATAASGGSGQGGGYGQVTNVPAGASGYGTAGTTSLTVQVGAPGTTNPTFLKNASGTKIVQGDFGQTAVGVTGGNNTQTNTGAALTEKGGKGANGVSSGVSTEGGPGGGGAGGPGGIGADGTGSTQAAGSGGSAAAGGSAGAITGGSGNGGAGGNDTTSANGGAGGTTGSRTGANGTPATGVGGAGGGGGFGAVGGVSGAGGNGASGQDWDASDGTGGGGGGGGGSAVGIGDAGNGGAGGCYGGGGAGAGANRIVSGTPATGGAGCNGIIVITYTQASPPNLLHSFGEIIGGPAGPAALSPTTGIAANVPQSVVTSSCSTTTWHTFTGSAPAMLGQYQPASGNWGNWTGNYPALKCAGSLPAIQIIAVPMIENCVPARGDSCHNGTEQYTTFEQVASGIYDVYFSGLAAALYADGYTKVYFRVGWEFNGNWYNWESDLVSLDCLSCVNGASAAGAMAALRFTGSGVSACVINSGTNATTKTRGLNYTAGDTLVPHSRNTSDYTTQAVITVETVDSSGRIATCSPTTAGSYSVRPGLGDFIAAFQDIALALRSGWTGAGGSAGNMQIWFNPNIGAPSTAWEPYYPGDSYVDGVALDAYDQYGTGSTPQQWFNGFLTESGGLNAMATFGTVGTANTTCGGTTCGPTVATGATKLWGSMEWGIWNGVSPPGIDDPYFIFGMATWLAGSGGANISQYYNSGPATLTKGTTPNAAAEYLRDFVQ